jgi:NAD(P)-dependent dehydrogenase (short-subunit alcohol dehydrogenase family)
MTILITGANRGIGLALLQRAGADAVGTARDTAAAPMVEGATWMTLDVGDPASVATMADDFGDRPLDLLVCNAGIYPDRGHGLTDGFPVADWDAGFRTNVTGVFLTIRALLPNLRAARGKIAIISSQMASHTRAPGGSYIYRASKAAVLNLGRNLASDLRGDGIAVGIYHPGWVRTDMGGGAADIGVDEAADGLMARFADLSLSTTGCFQTWDGRDHTY